MLALVNWGVHLIPLQAVHFKVIRVVHFILIRPVHFKVIWTVHLKCRNQNTAVEMCSILGGVNILFDAGIATWRITHREVADKLSEVAQNKGLTLKTIIIDEIIIRVAKILGKIYPPENSSLPISDESQSE